MDFEFIREQTPLYIEAAKLTLHMAVIGVLLAIVVGGAWFGIPGMALGVPTLAVVAALLKQAVGAGLAARGLDAAALGRDFPPMDTQS